MQNPNIRFQPTELARDQIRERGLILNQVIEMLRGPTTTWSGRKENQTFHQGTTPTGQVLQVLVERISDTQAKIVTLDWEKRKEG